MERLLSTSLGISIALYFAIVAAAERQVGLPLPPIYLQEIINFFGVQAGRKFVAISCEILDLKLRFVKNAVLQCPLRERIG